jgi:dihydroxyacetone kinase
LKAILNLKRSAIQNLRTTAASNAAAKVAEETRVAEAQKNERQLQIQIAEGIAKTLDNLPPTTDIAR